MTHNTAIEWADEWVELDAQQLETWACWKVWIDADYYVQYAKGPCPACGAMAQGYTTNQEAPIEAAPAEVEAEALPSRARPPIKIPVSCVCGFDHGHEDAIDCGRDWSVICGP